MAEDRRAAVAEEMIGLEKNTDPCALYSAPTCGTNDVIAMYCASVPGVKVLVVSHLSVYFWEEKIKQAVPRVATIAGLKDVEGVLSSFDELSAFGGVVVVGSRPRCERTERSHLVCKSCKRGLRVLPHTSRHRGFHCQYTVLKVWGTARHL